MSHINLWALIGWHLIIFFSNWEIFFLFWKERENKIKNTLIFRIVDYAFQTIRDKIFEPGTKLLSAEKFTERISDPEKIPLALIRFFSNKNTSETHNEDWATFMSYFYNQLTDYNGKMSVHQVDCDRDPVDACTLADGQSLPIIHTYLNNAIFSTFVPESENLQEYLDRTFALTQPNKPPERCCSTIRVLNHPEAKYNDVYHKTSVCSLFRFWFLGHFLFYRR